MLLRSFVVGSLVFASCLSAQDEPEPPALPQGETGTVKIRDLATVQQPEGWSYLAGKQGQDFLVAIGNPPDPEVLGVAIDQARGVFVVFTYSDDGHVADEDAASLDYDELLRTMQEGAREGSKERKQSGLAGVELLGWAEPPHYDGADKKLYYAKRLRFDDSQSDIVNYCVRVLGRSGVLELNAVGDMSDLANVATASKELLAATTFTAGNRYHEFDPSYDKIAAYGIGGLIAGKLLLKVGLFKVLLKPLLIAGALIAAGAAKIFGGRKRASAEAKTPA